MAVWTYVVITVGESYHLLLPCMYAQIMDSPVQKKNVSTRFSMDAFVLEEVLVPTL